MTRTRSTVVVFACLTVLLCAFWFCLTSYSPDGLQSVASKLGFAERAKPAAGAPMAGYRLALLGSPVAGRIAAALIGAALCFAAAWLVGKFSARKAERARAAGAGGAPPTSRA